MHKVTEFLTVKVAVSSMADMQSRYEAIGLTSLPASPWPDPPIEMTDVTVEFPHSQTAISLIEPWKGGGAVGRFIEKRGAGIYSIAVRVDSLECAMQEWAALGFEWVLDTPAEVPGGRAARYVADQVLVNWVKPKTFGGVLLEVFELRCQKRKPSFLSNAATEFCG